MDEINLEKLPAQLRLGMRTGLERWLSTIKAEFDSVFFPKEKGIEGEGE